MRLVYEGGSTLTFGLESGARQTVNRGEPFEVSDELATSLLADPHISEAEASGDGEGDVPRETALADNSKAQLQAIAAELGLELPKRATNATIVEAIEAEQQRLADEAAASAAEASGDGEGNEGGEDAPGDDPGVSAPGEPGTPPETGAITLGDLPESARVGS